MARSPLHAASAGWRGARFPLPADPGALRAPSIDGPSASRKRRRREAQLQWPSTAIETIERRFVQFSLFWLILLLAALAVVVFAHVCTRRHDRSDLPLPNAAEVPGIRCGHQ